MDDQMRAHQAELLLSNEIFKEALEQVNIGINREMDSIKTNDKESAYNLIQLRQAANKIIQHITNVANSNKVTEFNAKKKRQFFLT